MLEDHSLILDPKISKFSTHEGNSELETAITADGIMSMNDGEKSLGSEEDFDELREARIRTAQMEKTVQWWSECTANWREKWANVKNERNRARDDIKTLKSKLDSANEEIYKLKRERTEFSEGNTKLRRDVDRMEAELRRDRRAFVPPLRVVEGSRNENETMAVKTSTISESVKNEEQKTPENILIDAVPKALVEDELVEVVADNESASNKKQILESALSGQRQSFIKDKEEMKPSVCLICAEVRQELTVLKDRLENSEKNVLEEKSSKASLSDTVDELTAENEQLKGGIQEEKLAHEKAISELNRFKEEKQKKLLLTANSDSDGKEGDDRRVKEFRAQIEKLQKENASEWSKREKLETEKLAADRESKKLKHQVEDLKKELENKLGETTKSASFELKQIQTELEDKKRELVDLKASHLKLKRVYQDKKEDVLHTKTRVDHHEDEIKKLRTRVDELKQKLTTTEDEVDQKENLARKLQRSLDEQTQHCHVLQVQMEHLQSRWKQMTLMTRAPKRGENGGTELSEEERRLLELDDEF